MNILLVTQNMNDARFIEHELPKRIPGAHIETAQRVQEAIGGLASPSAVSAVLLDPMLYEGDAIAALRAIRAENSSIVVIGLVRDLDSGTKLIHSGADDFVIKAAGFVDGLASVLHRACADEPRSHAIEGAAWTGVLARSSLKPDTAGATRVLVRNNETVAARNYATLASAALEGRLNQKQPLSRQVEEEVQAAEYLSLNRKLLELQQRLQSTEEDRSRLQEALTTAQTALGDQSRLFQKERENLQSEWEVVRNRLELAEEQEKAAAEASRAEQESEKETAEQHAGELQKYAQLERDLEMQLQAAEEERMRLLGTLRELESQVACKTEELLRERAVLEQKQQHADEMWRTEKYELEERYRVIEAENTRLREALQEAEDGIASHIEQHRMQIGQRESARVAMEQQNHGLHERVARLEEANTRLAFENRELLTQLEAARRELETHASGLADELRRIIARHNDLVGKR